MAFPKSSRFLEYTSCSPSPTAYNIPSPFNDCAPTNPNNFNTWLKPCPYRNHKCDGKCQSECSNFKDAAQLKEPTSSKRYSLDPNYVKMANSNNKSNETTHEKTFQAATPRLSLQPSENKENTMSPQKNSVSNIPRFKKHVTEGRAPSFMSRPVNIHYCFPTIDENGTTPSGNFNRHSVKRKSIKPMKKNENIYRASVANPEECGLWKKRPFNKSYTILPSTEATTKAAIDTLSSTAQGAIPKHPDDIKKNNSKHVLQNLNVEKSPYFSKLLKKDGQLARELSSDPTNKKYYQIAVGENTKAEPAKSVDKDNKETGVKMHSHDVFALNDCNKIFLVGEEFIDDEYDSYINDLNESSGYSQVLQNKELYEMTKYLVRIYLEKNNTEENSTPTRKESEAKLDKSIRKKIGKLFNKRKKTNVVINRDVWREIEMVIRSAITELKGEFQRKIYQKTNEKLDQLVSELKRAVLTANGDIEDVCETKAVNLISRLENIALKAIKP